MSPVKYSSYVAAELSDHYGISVNEATNIVDHSWIPKFLDRCPEYIMSCDPHEEAIKIYEKENSNSD